MHGRQLGHGGLVPLIRTAVEFDDLAPEGAQDVAVRRVARAYHRDPLAGVEGGQEDRQECPPEAPVVTAIWAGSTSMSYQRR